MERSVCALWGKTRGWWMRIWSLFIQENNRLSEHLISLSIYFQTILSINNFKHIYPPSPPLQLTGDVVIDPRILQSHTHTPHQGITTCRFTFCCFTCLYVDCRTCLAPDSCACGNKGQFFAKRQGGNWPQHKKVLTNWPFFPFMIDRLIDWLIVSCHTLKGT